MSSSERHMRTQMAGTFRVYNDKLGKGSFATVYRGRCTVTNRDVAVKVIDLKKLTPDKDRFVRNEVRELQGLRHDNVVQLLDTQVNERHMLLIMELCSGGDLHAYIERHKRHSDRALSEAVAQHLFRQLIRGVEYLTSRNKMHRDLKSANLLLTSADASTAVLKIADFGLVKDTSAESGTGKVNMNETICGTPLYMAPERSRRGYGIASDIFSCGVILYEMLVGRVPFTGSSIEEISAQAERGVRSVLPKSHDLSWTVLDLLDQLLRADPEARPTPSEVLLHAWLTGPVGEAVPVPSPVTQPLIGSDSTPHHSSASLGSGAPIAESPPSDFSSVGVDTAQFMAAAHRRDFDRWMDYAEAVLQMAKEDPVHGTSAALFVYSFQCAVSASAIYAKITPRTATPEERLDRQKMHTRLMDAQRRSTGGFDQRWKVLSHHHSTDGEVAPAQQLIFLHALRLGQDGAVEESLGNAWSLDHSAVTAHSLYQRSHLLVRSLVDLDTGLPAADKVTCLAFLASLEKRCRATNLALKSKKLE